MAICPHFGRSRLLTKRLMEQKQRKLVQIGSIMLFSG
jgi:hypothetical protein